MRRKLDIGCQLTISNIFEAYRKSNFDLISPVGRNFLKRIRTKIFFSINKSCMQRKLKFCKTTHFYKIRKAEKKELRQRLDAKWCTKVKR